MSTDPVVDWTDKRTSSNTPHAPAESESDAEISILPSVPTTTPGSVAVWKSFHVENSSGTLQEPTEVVTVSTRVSVVGPFVPCVVACKA